MSQSTDLTIKLMNTKKTFTLKFDAHTFALSDPITFGIYLDGYIHNNRLSIGTVRNELYFFHSDIIILIKKTLKKNKIKFN